MRNPPDALAGRLVYSITNEATTSRQTKQEEPTMRSPFSPPARPAQPRSIARDWDRNPTWREVADLRLRPVEAATYSGLVAGLAPDEALIARVAVILDGRFQPQEREVACWVADSGKYNELNHGGPRDQQINGYYAVSKDRLLSLLFV